MDSWSQVELFRHQHGELPKSDDTRTVDYEKAFLAAAKSVREGKCEPHNAASMLNAAASICRTTAYGTKYNHKDGSCLACGTQEKKGRVKISLEHEGDAFDAFWCDKCCGAFFDQRRTGDKSGGQ